MSKLTAQEAAIILSRILAMKQQRKSDFERGILSPDVEEVEQLNKEIWSPSLAIENFNTEIKSEED